MIANDQCVAIALKKANTEYISNIKRKNYLMNIEKLISIYDKFVKSKDFDQEKINRNLLIQALKKENEKKLEESLNLYDLCKKEIPNNALINLKIGSNLEKLKKKSRCQSYYKKHH